MSLTQKVLNIGGGIAFGIANILFSGGCTEEANRFSRGLAEMGVQQAVVSGVRTEIEGPRSQNVNVYGSQENTNYVQDIEGNKRAIEILRKQQYDGQRVQDIEGNKRAIEILRKQWAEKNKK